MFPFFFYHHQAILQKLKQHAVQVMLYGSSKTDWRVKSLISLVATQGLV